MFAVFMSRTLLIHQSNIHLTPGLPPECHALYESWQQCRNAMVHVHRRHAHLRLHPRICRSLLKPPVTRLSSKTSPISMLTLCDCLLRTAPAADCSVLINPRSSFPLAGCAVPPTAGSTSVPRMVSSATHGPASSSTDARHAVMHLTRLAITPAQERCS